MIKKSVSFPVAHEEKYSQLIFKYLIYVSLPLSPLFAVLYSLFFNWHENSNNKIFYIVYSTFFWFFVFITAFHFIISLYYFYRMYKLTKKFNKDKNETMKQIQIEISKQFAESKSLILENNVQLEKANDFSKLKEGFKNKLAREKEDVRFNFALFSSVFSFFIAFSTSTSNDPTEKSVYLLSIIPIVIGISFFAHYINKKTYEKTYKPIKTELLDIIELLDEIIIYKTINENTKIEKHL